MTNRPTQDENEKPAKVWQVNEVSSKVDAVSHSLDEVKQMIAAQTNTYPTRTELALELEKRDNKIKSVNSSLRTISRVTWIVVTVVVGAAVTGIWQLLVNQGRTQ